MFGPKKKFMKWLCHNGRAAGVVVEPLGFV
jgi:hypothetical protein